MSVNKLTNKVIRMKTMNQLYESGWSPLDADGKLYLLVEDQSVNSITPQMFHLLGKVILIKDYDGASGNYVFDGNLYWISLEMIAEIYDEIDYPEYFI